MTRLEEIKTFLAQLSEALPRPLSQMKEGGGIVNQPPGLQRDLLKCSRETRLWSFSTIADLQAIVNLAIAWQKSFVHGRDITDEGFSVADEAAEQALYDAVELIEKGAES